MANHKSAEKRHRQSLRRRDRNRAAKATLRSAVKKTRAAVLQGDKATAKQSLIEAEGLLAKAAAKGIIHNRNAQRNISRLASLVAAGK